MIFPLLLASTAIEQPVELPMIWNVMMHMWHHYDVSVHGTSLYRPISKIPQCIRQISHNVPICAHVHISFTKWDIVGYRTGALWALYHRSLRTVPSERKRNWLMKWPRGIIKYPGGGHLFSEVGWEAPQFWPPFFKALGKNIEFWPPFSGNIEFWPRVPREKNRISTPIF